MPRLILCLVFIFLLPSQLFADEMRMIDKLALNAICAKKKTTPKEYKQLSIEVCQMIVQSELCQEIEPRLKRDCHADLKGEDDSSLKDNVFGCLEGILTSAHDIYQLVKSFLIFIKDYTSNEDYRMKKNQNFEAKIDNLLLNYEAEVLRVSSTLSGPLKDSRASLMVAYDLLTTQIGNIFKSLKNGTAEYACLNEAGITERSCQKIATILLPSAAFFKLILKGGSTLEAVVSSSIQQGKMFKAKRAEQKLINNLTKEGPVKDAFEAHKDKVINNFKKGLETNRHESATLKFKEDKQKVSELYRKGEVKEAAKLNYQLNINRLVEQFPPHVKENLTKLLSNDYRLIDSIDFDGKFGASMSKPNGFIQIELPAKFHGTELEYFIKTHESYHAVMHYLNGLETTKSLHLKVNLLNDLQFLVKERFLNEAGAIAREWQYVDHIPKERLKQMLSELKTDSKCPADLLEFAQKNMTGEKSASSHVIQAHKNGRYSKKKIIDQVDELEGMYKKNILWKNMGVGIKAVGLGLMTKQVYSYCSKLQKSGGETQFYQDICQKFPLFLGHF